MRSLSSTLRVAALGATLVGALAAPCPALADGPGYGGNADSLVCHWRLKIGGKGAGLLIFAVGFRAGSQAHLRVGAGADRLVLVDGSGAIRILVVLDVSSRKAPSPAATPSPRATSRATPTPTATAPSRTVPSRTSQSRRVVSHAFMIGPAMIGPVAIGPVTRTTAASTPAAQPTDTTVLTVPGDSAGRMSPGTSVLVVGETPAGGLRTLVGSVPPPESDSGVPALLPGTGAAASLGAVLFWFRRRRATAAGGVHRQRPAARHRA